MSQEKPTTYSPPDAAELVQRERDLADWKVLATRCHLASIAHHHMRRMTAVYARLAAAESELAARAKRIEDRDAEIDRLNQKVADLRKRVGGGCL